MKKIREFLSGLKYNFMNYIVPNIPFWRVRKLFYVFAGMKIGDARILMKVQTQGWKNIVIEDGVYINEYCYLDGRGGLTIKKNSSISIYSKIISGTHQSDSSSFCYMSRPVLIENNVWVGANSMILPGAVLESRCILAAGSVAIRKTYQSNRVYSGVPAEYVCERHLAEDYILGDWKPWFR